MLVSPVFLPARLKNHVGVVLPTEKASKAMERIQLSMFCDLLMICFCGGKWTDVKCLHLKAKTKAPCLRMFMSW